MNNVVFIYHVNFNHLSLTFEQRENYISHFDYLLSKITFPITLSIFGEDLIILSLLNPKALEALRENQNIRLFIPQYSHMLPYMFDKLLDIQINLGKRIVSHLGLTEKMNNILYSSEVDYLSPEIWPNLSTYVGGMIVGETRVRVAGLDGTSYPSIFTTKFNEKPIFIYVSRRKFAYREQLHKFLRDEIDSIQMNRAILSDMDNYAKQIPLIARIDFEVLVFNALKNSNVTLINRIDKWIKYMECLTSVDIKSVFLEDINVIAIPHLDENMLSRNTVEDYRWNNDDLYNALMLYDYTQLSSDKKAIFLSLLCSDYFCSNLIDFVFETSYGKLVICKTRKYRDLESYIKLCLLQDKVVTTEDSYLREYVRTFLKVIERVEVLL